MNFFKNVFCDFVGGPSATVRPFRLARHFSLAALTCVIIAGALLGATYRFQVSAGAAGILLLLFAALWLIVRRADRILHAQADAGVRAEAERDRLDRTLRMVGECNQLLVRARNKDELRQGVCRIIAQAGDYAMVWVAIADSDGVMRPAAYAGRDSARLWPLVLAGWSGAPDSEKGLLHCSAASHGAICSTCDVRAKQECSVAFKAFGDVGVLACTSLPLRRNGRLIGTLMLHSDREDPIPPVALATLAELADDLAFGLTAHRDLRLLHESEERLRMAMLAASMTTWQWELAPDRITLGENAAGLIGPPDGDGRFADVRQHIVAEDLPLFVAAASKCIEGTQDFNGEFRISCADGRIAWIEVIGRPVREASGRITHLTGVLRDITQRHLTDEALRHNAAHDALTGLANYALFTDRLQQALIHDRRLGRSLAALSLDMDRFKLVNDSLGHQGGDELLKLIATRLANAVRSGDTVARVSGNEFAILLTDIADEQDLVVLADKLLACIADPVVVAGQLLSLTGSLGISVHPRDGSDPEILLRSASAAMRTSKASGGNAFTFYTAEMNVRAQERLQLEASIHLAIERNEFVLHYQPQMCLQTGRITGVEALVRWQHPERGLIGPNEFIPVAEENGLIRHIGNWVMATAAAQAVAWQRAGHAALRVAVNVSARQLVGPELAARVAAVLKDTGLTPSLLELELTETAVMRNPDEALATLRAIRAMGVSLAMDDFGTGYSSLGYLRRFPFNVLKIDRSFVSGIVNDPDDALVVRSIVSMSASLGMEVVAEGVETEAQAAVLVNAGCALIQGYWLSRPIAPDALAELLREHLPAMALPGGLVPRARRSLLLVDDEPHVLSALRRLFRPDGYDILTAENAEKALELLAIHSVGVVLSDQRMPKTSGTELLKRVKRMYPETVRIVLTGYMDVKSVADAVNEGAIYKFVTKPWDGDQLRELVREAFDRYDLACENQRLRNELTEAQQRRASVPDMAVLDAVRDSSLIDRERHQCSACRPALQT